MQKNITLILLSFLFLSPVAMAETKEDRAALKHEFRIGWGDQLFESLVWRDRGYSTSLPADQLYTRNEHYRYTQHFWTEYHYRFNHWFSMGAMLDGSGVYWDQVTRNGAGVEQSRTKNQHLYNLVIMPTIRFTYLHTKYVSLHSGLGLGLDINGGTEIDGKGRKTVPAAAFQITWLGMTVGYGHWYGAIELNGLHAFENGNYVYLMGSKMTTASVGYRF